jgi:hypothetical protein
MNFSLRMGGLAVLPSWPDLCRPSTSKPVYMKQGVDARQHNGVYARLRRAMAGHDGEFIAP